MWQRSAADEISFGPLCSLIKVHNLIFFFHNTECSDDTERTLKPLYSTHLISVGNIDIDLLKMFFFTNFTFWL